MPFRMTDNITCWFAGWIQDKFEEEDDELRVIVKQDGYGGLESLCHEIIHDNNFDEDFKGPSSFFDAAVNSVEWPQLRFILQKWLDNKDDKVDLTAPTFEY
jgi:hypothetical protein